MKRILLVSPFPPYIGGVSVSVQRLYDHLREEGYDVDKFNTQIENRKYNSKMLKFLKYLGLPLCLVFRKRYDVIHFHVSKILPKLYVSMWRYLFSKKTKFIITVHGQVKNAFMSWKGYLALKGFDRIICVKKGDSRNMPAAFISKAVEIPAFIPPVIDIEFNIPDIPGLGSFLKRGSFRMLINGFIILNNSFYDLYGFRDSLQLLDQLRAKGRNADLILVVIGDNNREAGAYLSELKDFVKAKNLEKNVFWIENPSMELWPLLRQVDVLIRPTKTDGDAMSVREALFLGIPVITSDIVPRPSGALVYKLKSPQDLLIKTIMLMDNYDNYVSSVRSGNGNQNFAYQIIEQYENC